MTLDQTWALCLEMWKWVSEQTGDVEDLKKEWLKAHGFKWRDIAAACFFCEYNSAREASDDCNHCPGKLVDEDFDCQDDPAYDEDPVGFYAGLLVLHAIYLKGKK